MRLESWVNEQRRTKPMRFWMLYMLPFSLVVIFGGLGLIAWAVKSGWLK